MQRMPPGRSDATLNAGVPDRGADIDERVGEPGAELLCRDVHDFLSSATVYKGKDVHSVDDGRRARQSGCDTAQHSRLALVSVHHVRLEPAERARYCNDTPYVVVGRYRMNH